MKLFLLFTTAPLAPRDLTVTYPIINCTNESLRNSTILLVSWERPSCDRGILSGYELCYVRSSIGDCTNNGITVNITGPDQLSYTITDLLINTEYIIELRGRTGRGLGDTISVTNSTDEDGEL